MATAPTGLADRVMGNIRGGTDAQRLLQTLRGGLAPADALHEALQAELATGDAERLRGFARTIQKVLEQALGAA